MKTTTASDLTAAAELLIGAMTGSDPALQAHSLRVTGEMLGKLTGIKVVFCVDSAIAALRTAMRRAAQRAEREVR